MRIVIKPKAAAAKGGGTPPRGPRGAAAIGGGTPSPYHPPAHYDPCTRGADCVHCPMRRWHGASWAPVPPQTPERGLVGFGGKRVVLLGELPGRTEVVRGGPFLGPSGLVLNDGLKDAAIARDALHIENVVECPAPPLRLRSTKKARLEKEKERGGRRGRKRDEGGEGKYEQIGLRMRQDEAAGAMLPWEKHPEEHCRGRVETAVFGADIAIPMGGAAAHAILGGAAGILSIRGAPTTARRGDREIAVLPTVSPAFVMRQRSMMRTFVNDFRRARRLATGVRAWAEANVLCAPSPKQLRAFLHGRWPLPGGPPAKDVGYWSVDIETSREGALRARLYCIGIGRDRGTAVGIANGSADGVRAPFTSPDVVVVPFWDIESGAPFYASGDAAEIEAIVGGVWGDGRQWVSHNGTYFDNEVISRRWPPGIPLDCHLDTIVEHALAWSECRHGLKIIGPDYCDVDPWGTDEEGRKIATDARTNEELWQYNGGRDVPVTHVLAPLIHAEVVEFGQADPCPGRPSLTLDRLLHRMSGDVCRGMHRVGMLVDQEERVKVEGELSMKAERFRKASIEAAEVVGWSRGMHKGRTPPTFNPGSVEQVRRLFFDLMKLEPWKATETGEPSTDDECLREYLTDMALSPAEHEVVRYIRGYREARHDLSEVEKMTPGATDSDGNPIIHADGRIHTNWWAFRVVSTRLASGDPFNMQNWKKWMRRLIVAAPGHRLVGGDMDAIEGRVAAGRWKLKKYIDAFVDGLDVHQLTMALALGDRIWTFPGAPKVRYRKAEYAANGRRLWEIGGKFDGLRTLIKRYFYAKLYGASDETVLGILREVEIDENEWRKTAPPGAVFTARDAFPYAHYTEAKIAAISKRFLQALPELPAGWATEEQFVTDHGYNVESITGRRRRFLDGRNPNEERNFGVQPTAAGIVNLGTLDFIDDVLPFDRAGDGIGLIQQGHDSLVAEVPEDEADEVARGMTASMTQTFPGVFPGMVFPMKAKTGRTWKDVA